MHGTTVTVIGPALSIVGRQPELEAIARFLDDVAAGPGALLIEGEPGIGKTTLWREGLRLAAERGKRVLSTRPAESETRLSFTALSDLIDRALDDVSPRLPDLQRRALEAALLRGAGDLRAPDQRAVSLAVLGVLRALAEDGPTLLAADDVQWLDPPSSRVLGFAIRRLRGEPVAVMATLRSGWDDPLGLDRALAAEELRRLGIGPLAEAELRGLLRVRTGTDFPRPIVRKIVETSGGNPFFALEIARALVATGSRIEPGQPLPVPKDLRQLLHDRIDALTPTARGVLPVAAAATRPTVQLVAAVAGEQAARAAIGEAVDAGLVELDRGSVAFTHPLLGSTVYEATPADARRAVHARLAEAVRDPEERARHLALAARGPDPGVSGALEEAAEHAAGRGAMDAAAELAELGMQLAPPDDAASLAEGFHAAATYAFDAGDALRARELLNRGLTVAPSGPQRAPLLNRLAMARWNNVRFIVEHLEAALAEAAEDPDCRAETNFNLAWAWLYGGDLGRAERHARESSDAAEKLAARATQDQRPLVPMRRRQWRTVLALVRALRGRESEDLLSEAAALDQPPVPMESGTVPTVLGMIRTWTGDLEEARTALGQEASRLADLGKETLRWELLVLLAEVETRAGNYELAGRHAEEAYDIAVEAGLEDALDELLFQRALVAAFIGRADEARALALEGLGIADVSGDRLFSVQHRSLLGFIELSLGDAEAAHGCLGPLPAELHEMGVGEPGAFPLVWDDVDALVALGRPAEAEPIVAHLEERAVALDRAWVRGLAARSRGLLAAATGNLRSALDATEGALEDLARTRFPFDHARTLLLRGEIHRRAKRKRPAGESLGEALRVFEDLGARLWAARARAELERVRGAVTGPAGLTPTERRVAELVAAGKTNREVADALFISVKTVEANLSRIFQKLGVRSRAELIRELVAGDAHRT